MHATVHDGIKTRSAIPGLRELCGMHICTVADVSFVPQIPVCVILMCIK